MSRKNFQALTPQSRGFTLMEVLLSLGLLAFLLGVGTHIIQRYTRMIMNERSAEQMLTVQRAAEQYAKSNFEQLLSATDLDEAGEVRLMTIADLITSNFLPTNFPNRNSLRMPMSVVLRNGTATGADPALEILTVTGNAQSGQNGQIFEWISDAANFGRGKLGILSNAGGGFSTTEFRSTSRNWVVARNDLTGYNPIVPAQWDSSNPTGYLAAYGRLSSASIFDNDVLYRTNTGNLENNQMQGTLDMNGHDVNTISTMTADSVSAGALNLTRGGNAPALGIDGQLIATNDININGNLTIYSDPGGSGQDFSAQAISFTNPASTVNTTNFSSVNAAITNNLVAHDASTETMTGIDMVVTDQALTNNTNLWSSSMQLGGNATGNTITRTGALTNYMAIFGGMLAGEIDLGTSNFSELLITGRVYPTQISNNLNVESITSIPALRANSVLFRNLCYVGTSGTLHEVDRCP